VASKSVVRGKNIRSGSGENERKGGRRRNKDRETKKKIPGKVKKKGTEE